MPRRDRVSPDAARAEQMRVDRATLLVRAGGLLVAASPLAALLTGCGGGRGMMIDKPPEWMMSHGMDAQMMRDMHVIHDLLAGHEQIDRSVEDIAGGVRATTTSRDAEIGQLIRTHVWRMKERVESGNAIRLMDPLFREIFDHHEKIEMRIQELPRGVRVIETSPDAQVALLIRQHAHRAVSEFVSDGFARAMEPTPLPPGYRG